MKKTIILAAALVAMTACNKSIIETQLPESEYGYINLGVTADTEMTVITKGGDAPETPVYNDYYVTLIQGSTVKWGPTKYSEVSDWKVAAGTGYTLRLENKAPETDGSSNGYESIHIVGTSVSFDVQAGLETDVDVACVPVNSMVTVANNGFTDVFEETKITIIDANNHSKVMTWGHEQSNGAYYPANSTISWTLEVTMKDGITKKRYTCPENKKFTTQADKWSQLTFSTTSTSGEIKVAITVDGTIDSTIILTEDINPLEGEVVTPSAQ